jgi:fumarate reductase flavoprotein subunit
MEEGTAFPDLAKAWAENCARSVEWLRSSGLEMVETSQGTIALEPYSSISLAPVYKKDVGSSILRKLKSGVMSAGGNYAHSVRAGKLMVNHGVVQGLSAQKNNQPFQITSKATILATGGFSANRDMLVQHIGQNAAECKLRGSPNDTGDGLQMALEVGAKAVNLNYFYGHLVSLKALTDDRFWPYPRVDGLLAEGLLIDRSGNRFVDEGRGDVAVTNEVARSQDVTGACLVFDEAAWNGARGDTGATLPRTPAPNPWLAEHDGFLYKASSPEELAKKIDVNPTALARELQQFNRACESGGTEALKPKRTGTVRPLRAPYHGLKVVPGITFTMGGPLINGRAEVLDVEERPIRGLYAAGDVIGGLMGGFNGGYMGGLAQAVITGLLAGESAAAYAKTT